MGLFGGPMKRFEDIVATANFNISCVVPLTEQKVRLFESQMVAAAQVCVAKGKGREAKELLRREHSDHPTWTERDTWNALLDRVATTIPG